MKPGDLVNVNEFLKGGDGCTLAIYLANLGPLVRILLATGKILDVHSAHLRML